MRAALRPSSRCSVTVLVAIVALGLAACSGSASPTNPPVSAAAASEGSAPSVVMPAPSAASPTQTGSMSPAPTDSGGTASAPASGPTAVPTALDPCQLITSQEAGRLASTSFGAGKEEKLSGNGKMCTYGYQTKNVFEVIVVLAVVDSGADGTILSAEYLPSSVPYDSLAVIGEGQGVGGTFQIARWDVQVWCDKWKVCDAV